MKAAQVHALLKNRTFVTPDDIKAMAVPVLAHRIIPKGLTADNSNPGEKIINNILEQTAVPLE